MGKFIKLLCAAALLGMVHGAANATDRACKFTEGGYGYYRVEQKGEPWTYLLTVSGPNWRNLPYGYHAPGLLDCEGCFSAGKAWGLYHFAENADVGPATAAERAERRKEWFGYPIVSLGPEHLDHQGSRERIALGPLTGYAVVYRVVEAPEHELLVIHLTDGCVAFETTIIVESSGSRAWVSLDSILREVTIEKARGARPGPSPPTGGYGATVRPRE
jgi:hypothetical protein